MAILGMPPSPIARPLKSLAAKLLPMAWRAALLMMLRLLVPSKPMPAKCSMSSWSTP